jgi:hypothetical protein
VIYFAETKKGWILNKTNIKCLIALFGTETDDWLGKQVTVYPEKNEHVGERRRDPGARLARHRPATFPSR